MEINPVEYKSKQVMSLLFTNDNKGIEFTTESGPVATACHLLEWPWQAATKVFDMNHPQTPLPR